MCMHAHVIRLLDSLWNLSFLYSIHRFVKTNKYSIFVYDRWLTSTMSCLGELLICGLINVFNTSIFSRLVIITTPLRFAYAIIQYLKYSMLFDFIIKKLFYLWLRYLFILKHLLFWILRMEKWVFEMLT